MKIVISKVELMSLIGKVQNVIAQKPTLPILSNILLEAVDDGIVLVATDLTVSIKAHAPAKVLQEGSITLPARRFFQLIREIHAPTIEIHCPSPEVANIHAGSSQFRLLGINHAEFPSFPDLSEGVSFSMESSTFREMLNRSSFAAARDDHRQILNGILLQGSGNKATFIGTDGKRLAQIYTKLDLQLATLGSYVIPLKAVEEMVKLLDDNDSPVKVCLMLDKISIETDTCLCVSKLLVGQYPDVSRVIPQKVKSPISLHREELISLLRQVALFTSEENQSVRFTFDDQELNISANGGGFGEGKVSMPVNYAGPKLEIAFNPNYFLDILKHCRDETVDFEVSDSYNPGCCF